MGISKFVVSVDSVIFGYIDGVIHTPLYRRSPKKDEPFPNKWSLPGGPIQANESFEQACQRKLEEDLEIKVGYLEQLYTFGAPERDPRSRSISVSYLALIRLNSNQMSRTGSGEINWFPMSDLPKSDWAFDHEGILKMAIKRLKAKVTYEPIGLNLLDEEFSIPQLQLLYESILERKLDRRNFAKKIHSFSLLLPTKKLIEGRGRPTQFFKFDMKQYRLLIQQGFIFEI